MNFRAELSVTIDFPQRLLTAECRVKFQFLPCEICRGDTGTGTVFSRDTSVLAAGWTVRGSIPVWGGGGRGGFAAPIPTGPGTQQPSYTMCTRSVTREYGGQDVALNNHPIGRRG